MTEQLPGLNEQQVEASRELHGTNKLDLKEDKVLADVLKGIVTEPMFILLLIACLIYFILGEMKEGIIMLISILLVAGISLFQDYRSKNAIRALNKLAAARSTVRRRGTAIKIPSEEIVTRDILILEEGEIVAADGIILQANDFSLNESMLTGESLSVAKTAADNNTVYKGTLVTSGSAVIRVTAVGRETMFGKIGISIKEISIVKTPLQIQISSFVKTMAWVGGIAFLLVVAINYLESENWVQSLLQGLTLAMSVLPEEIPVAFSTFQALGAFRLLKNSIIVKQPQYVETLGSATVICTDKTGTLTQNKMSIAFIYDAGSDTVTAPVTGKNNVYDQLLEFAMWSSETNPFDPMEKAIHQLYEENTDRDKRKEYNQVHEYPIGGNPPMMTHIFSNPDKGTIIAVKGAPEAILKQSELKDEERIRYITKAKEYASRGYRVLGVGKGSWKEAHWPVSQEEFIFQFLGLIIFQDPPKENIRTTLDTFRRAGISVKMITGDFPETALAIAEQVNLENNREVLTGKEVLALNYETLRKRVSEVNIYARMFPEAKLKVIEALKDNGEIVAMTGDGVNDGPALKAAHIGIAMGVRGSEVAKNAASLILADDDLIHMTEAVALGRKISDNLKKAIQYIVSIHIPIILIVAVPLFLSWQYARLFTPVHVIFLELIMGPTCSIIYENEPIEPGTMNRLPLRNQHQFLSFRQLSLSIIQGLFITAGCLGAGYYFMQTGENEKTVRTVVFITLLFSNILLTLANRSFRYSIRQTILYKNNLMYLILSITTVFIFLILNIPYLRGVFNLEMISFNQILLTFSVAFIAVGWIEVWKLIRKVYH
jgi:Ca2+-transporting ATPase